MNFDFLVPSNLKSKGGSKMAIKTNLQAKSRWQTF